MIKLLIVDDEKDARDFNKSLITEFFPKIEIIGTASSALEAIKIINSNPPDILISDIEMPGGSGFDILESTQKYNYEVIFITAYNQYAVKAFRFSAIDYLLKPVDIQIFKEAIQKAIDRRKLQNTDSRIEFLLQNYKKEKSEKIAINIGNSIEIITINDIIRFEADGQYTYIYIDNGKKLYAIKRIGEFEEILVSHSFFRAHSSHLINMNKINRFVKSEGGYIVMSDNSQIEVSRRRKEEFAEKLRLFSK